MYSNREPTVSLLDAKANLRLLKMELNAEKIQLGVVKIHMGIEESIVAADRRQTPLIGKHPSPKNQLCIITKISIHLTHFRKYIIYPDCGTMEVKPCGLS